MTESESVALPLGDTPILIYQAILADFEISRKRFYRGFPKKFFRAPSSRPGKLSVIPSRPMRPAAFSLRSRRKIFPPPAFPRAGGSEGGRRSALSGGSGGRKAGASENGRRSALSGGKASGSEGGRRSALSGRRDALTKRGSLSDKRAGVGTLCLAKAQRRGFFAKPRAGG